MDKVTQSNAASAEESAAAAEELNAQAETMKQSVTELQQLVGGKGQNTVTRKTAAPLRNQEIHIVKPVAKRSAPLHGNGHARRVTPAKSIVANGRSEIPMDGDFKDF
jgi:methyl-accepting chemotaxis protein